MWPWLSSGSYITLPNPVGPCVQLCYAWCWLAVWGGSGFGFWCLAMQLSQMTGSQGWLRFPPWCQPAGYDWPLFHRMTRTGRHPGLGTLPLAVHHTGPAHCRVPSTGKPITPQCLTTELPTGVPDELGGRTRREGLDNCIPCAMFCAAYYLQVLEWGGVNMYRDAGTGRHPPLVVEGG